jgi:NADH-ubiquinone oxidoreductase chain 2
MCMKGTIESFDYWHVSQSRTVGFLRRYWNLLIGVTTLKLYMIFTSLLSLGGLPPFLGFLPKWIVIQAIITNNTTTLATIVVVTSLITLYYYLKISYSSFIIFNTEPKWNLKFHKNKSTKSSRALILSSISLIGIAAYTIITNII